MTYGRTTELLREGLTERGIEWSSGLKGVTFVGDWCFVEYDNGKLAATCEPVLTPEQAIAATLGSERERKLELLVKHLWYLVNHGSGYGYAAALEVIEELGIEVDE